MTHNKKIVAATLAALMMVMAGCIVSGTFMIVKPFDFTTGTGFYYYLVDITNEQDWKDHKDQIDDIDLVGFELWFNNPTASDVTFNCWIDDSNNSAKQNYLEIVQTTKILDGLTLPPGKSHLTYGNSFQYIMNVPTLKTLVKSGMFHYYGTSDNGQGTFTVDSGKVIVTFSASGS